MSEELRRIKKIIDIVPINDFKGKEFTEYISDPKKGEVYASVYSDKVIVYQICNELEENKLNPGIYNLRKDGYSLKLVPKNMLLEPNVEGVEFVDISEKINIFLEKSHFFSERDLIPKLGFLLHGPAGCGKTHSINKCIKDLVGENGLALYLSMDEVSISNFISLLEDSTINPKIDKFFIIIEDLGGGEMTDEKKGFLIPSMNDLLSLLDGNSLPWKKLPTVMLSTTNYPKNFLENILDRPGRFDEVIEFKLPSGEAALSYAESLKVPLTEFDKRSILEGNIGLAHVKWAVVKSAVYNYPVHRTLSEMRERTKQVKKDIEKKVDPWA